MIYKEIVMVGCQHFNSGIGNYGYELSKNIRKHMPSLTLYKPAKSDHSDSHFHLNNKWIKPISYRSFRNLHPYILPLYIKNAVSSNANIYHAHWFLSGLAMTYAKRKNLVITMHDVSLLHEKESNKLFTNYYKWAINKFKKKRIPLIMVSENARQDAIKYANYPEKLLHVVHNGINFERFKPTKSDTRKNKKFNIIYTGGLGKRKNLSLLLKAFQKLENKYDQIELKIAGAFPEYTSYPEMAQHLKIKNVEFTGYIPDHQLNGFYNEADLMIYTSKYEGFGFAPLEAMATGVPVLTTTGGALKETAGSGATFIDYDQDDIVEKASKIIESEYVRAQMITNGFEWVRNFTWEKAAQKTLKIYQNIQ